MFCSSVLIVYNSYCIQRVDTTSELEAEGVIRVAQMNYKNSISVYDCNYINKERVNISRHGSLYGDVYF